MSEPVEIHVEGGPEQPPGGGGGLLMLPGLAFIALGIIVLVWPDLIRILVAAAFIFAGIGLLIAASKINRLRRRFGMLGGRR